METLNLDVFFFWIVSMSPWVVIRHFNICRPWTIGRELSIIDWFDMIERLSLSQTNLQIKMNYSWSAAQVPPLLSKFQKKNNHVINQSKFDNILLTSSGRVLLRDERCALYSADSMTLCIHLERCPLWGPSQPRDQGLQKSTCGSDYPPVILVTTHSWATDFIMVLGRHRGLKPAVTCH